jgi:hypothetical protein
MEALAAGPSSSLPTYLCPQAIENKRAIIYEKVKSVKGKKLEARCGQEYQSKEVRCPENTLGAERVLSQLVSYTIS